MTEYNDFPCKILWLFRLWNTTHLSFQNQQRKYFYFVGRTIGKFSRTLLFLFLLSIFFVFGLPKIQLAQSLQEGFISSHSRARIEAQIKNDFEGKDGRYIQKFVALVRRKDQGNLLDRSVFKEVASLYKFLKTKITVEVERKIYHHSNFCGAYCESNQLLWAFQQCTEGVWNDSDVYVDHPQSWFGIRNFLIAPHVFGIKRKTVESEENLMPTINASFNSSDTWPANSSKTALNSVAMFSLYFRAPIPDDKTLRIITEWEEAVFKWSQNPTRPFSQFSIDVMGDKVLGREMTQSGLSLLPNLAIGILSISIVVTFLITVKNMVNGSRTACGTTFLIAGTIISPMLAILTTFGFIGLLLIEIYPIVVVVPFICLAIGVDDAFLMMESWDHLRYRHPEKSSTDMMAMLLVDIGPSMTITSLTNAISFAVGSIFAVPAMKIFGYTAAAAISVDFIFQIVFFGSILVLADRYKRNGTMSDPSESFISKMAVRYSKQLTRRRIQVIIIIATIVYLFGAIYGTMTMTTQVDSQKIIPNNSPLRITDNLFKEFYWKEFEPVFVYVNNPPKKLSQKTHDELRLMIKDFESMPRSIGNTSTVFWLDHYERETKFLYRFHNLFGNFHLDYIDVPFFVTIPIIGELFNETIKWHKEGKDVVVDQFFFIIGLHNTSSWMERAETMLRWREVADKWNKFNITVYNDNSAVYEGIFSLSGQTILTFILTLVINFAICLLFIPSLAAVVCAAGSIASIAIGVVGYMSLSGLDLDPVTMSAIMMAIGFSVDYTAHISYHFHQSFFVLPSTATSADRLIFTITSVGWPMVEASVTTLSCFISPAFHPDYTPLVFVRAVFLVILFGMIHGLVILPTILVMISERFFIFDSTHSTPVRDESPMGILNFQDTSIVVNTTSKPLLQ